MFPRDEDPSGGMFWSYFYSTFSADTVDQIQNSGQEKNFEDGWQR
jgi:hypothetical protein